MPWNMTDYPPSMKNLEELVRKKAIAIGNALLSDGYPDDRAIPIAIKQAKEWYENADKSEKKEFSESLLSWFFFETNSSDHSFRNETFLWVYFIVAICLSSDYFIESLNKK